MDKASPIKAENRIGYFLSLAVQPLPGSIIIGTLVLLGTIAVMHLTFYLMSDQVPMASYVASLLCTYGIGSPVAFFFLQQNRRLKSVLAELEEIHELLKARSRIDRMTGLLNRETFLQEAEKAFAGAEQAAILIADIDNFKFVNDTWGHLAGDRAIELVASSLAGRLGEHCEIGRIGGEEFAILLTGENVQQAKDIAERLRLAIQGIEFFPARGMRQPLTISIGGAQAKDGSVVTDIVRSADRCLYRAKNSGRNRTEFDKAA